jgi:hypothetical protein
MPKMLIGVRVSSTVAEHLTLNPKIEDSNPVFGKKMSIYDVKK